MKSDEVSRRFVVGALGVGAATAAAGAATGATRAFAKATARPEARSVSSPPTPGPGPSNPVEPALARTLVAPLAPGDRLGRWTVEQILPVEGGAASIVLLDARGERFQLDICKRGESPVAPGRSELFDVFLANSGDGSKATYEEHGLAAMALAEVIRSNERRVDPEQFWTQARRAAENRARVHIA